MRYSERKVVRLFYALAARIAGMKGFRFSLWSMFLGVAAVAIVCAALVKPTETWAMAFQATALGVLTFGLLAALVYERSAARAFWIGFAVVGWGNLGLHRFPLSEIRLTHEISEWLMDAIHPFPPPSASPPPIDPSDEQPRAEKFDPYGGVPDPTPNPTQLAMIARDRFSYLVVWIWPLLLGFVGGVVAQQLFLRRERLVTRPSPSG
ncbi:MAG TPA: hypothetical protein VMV10_30210 [Pirellulales bacterium]|nr:hypothetical protein [Pirellulales bacterium]